MKSKAKTKSDFTLAWRAGAIALWLAAALWIIILAGYNATDPTPLKETQGAIQNPLGLAGAILAGLAYDIAGLAAWWLAVVLALAGFLLWRERESRPLVLAAAASVWLVLATAALLGFSQVWVELGGRALLLGGRGGSVMASSLLALMGPYLAWMIPAVIVAGGVGLLVWAAWPMIGPYLEPQMFKERLGKSAPAMKAKPRREPEPEAEPAPETEPALDFEPVIARNQPEPESEPAPVAGPGDPVIRPRAKAPAPVEPAAPQARAAFKLPGLDLLQRPDNPPALDREEVLKDNSRRLEKKLLDFSVQGRVMEVAPGPVVTMYEFKPAPGVKISKVAGLADDLAMNLKARSIRIVAPIPGKAVIGIEIPSQSRETVFLREVLASPAYQKAESPLTVALGKDILGVPVADDLARMPHLLIAGATGSGKSVFINTLVLSILYKASPDMVRLLMVDPKRIELSSYNDIPHLLYPIITSPQEATAGLRWAVAEMERRYELLAAMGVRNISSFNQKLAKEGWPASLADNGLEPPDGPLPYVVIIIDEMADLMMVSSKEVESLVTRLAQMARAAGMHLVLATQRPSVDVITGLIKANFPARISFQVTSRVDSRTILDQQGAEHLLGKGDMLFTPPGTASVARLHGAYVSDKEIETVARFWKDQARPEYDESIVQTGQEEDNGGDNGLADELYPEAVGVVKQSGQASISYVQRRLRVGYNRAARMIERMEREGIVGPSDGSRPREVLIRD